MLFSKNSHHEKFLAGHYTRQPGIRLQLLLLVIVAFFYFHPAAAAEELSSIGLNLMPWPVKDDFA